MLTIKYCQINYIIMILEVLFMHGYLITQLIAFMQCEIVNNQSSDLKTINDGVP